MSAELDSSQAPLIHVICGSTGAGKSTYAKRLQIEIGAVHFSIDDWMVDLFGPDLQQPMDWNWIRERALRCEDKILSIATALAETGTSSILEIGLQRASRRTEIATTIHNSGCSFQTHFLDVSAQERWKRVQQRNTEKGETFKLEVDKEMFDFFEQMWEPPSEDELLLLDASDSILAPSAPTG